MFLKFRRVNFVVDRFLFAVDEGLKCASQVRVCRVVAEFLSELKSIQSFFAIVALRSIAFGPICRLINVQVRDQLSLSIREWLPPLVEVDESGCSI